MDENATESFIRDGTLAGGRPAPVPYWDAYQDEEWPNGCCGCGYPNEDHYFGNTPEEAIAKWKAAPDPIL